MHIFRTILWDQWRNLRPFGSINYSGQIRTRRRHATMSILCGSLYASKVEGRVVFHKVVNNCYGEIFNAGQCFHKRVKEKQVQYLPGDMHWWPHPLKQHIFPPKHPPRKPQSSAQRPPLGLGQGERKNPRFSTASRLTAVNDIKAKHTNDWLNVRKMKERRNDKHSTGFYSPVPCNFLFFLVEEIYNISTLFESQCI